MKSLKPKTAASYHSEPVWCHHCCIRIAPYDLKTVSHGKNYHRGCYTKVTYANGKGGKN